MPLRGVLFLDYGVAGEPWHERALLCEGAAAGSWYVVTLDMDIYEEEVTSPPLRGVRAGVAGGHGLPAGLGARAGQPVYRFTRPLGERAFQSHLATAEDMKRREAGDSPRPAAPVLPVLADG